MGNISEESQNQYDQMEIKSLRPCDANIDLGQR